MLKMDQKDPSVKWGKLELIFFLWRMKIKNFLDMFGCKTFELEKEKKCHWKVLKTNVPSVYTGYSVEDMLPWLQD
jgi:hypothetical protein